ncbi:hypothetical protein ACFQ0P_04250 [Microbacterium insulae]|uniref:Uncharacterized protein n=1 Tax=Microbacterium insulae TaxID=483014 RepID=A0ABW3AGD2_9MICO
MCAPLTFTENVSVNGQDRAGVIAEILRDFVHRRAEPKPRRCRIVPKCVPVESEQELADDAYGQLSALSVGEEVVAVLLAGGMLTEDSDGPGGQGDRATAAPRLGRLLVVPIRVRALDGGNPPITRATPTS